MSSRVPAAVVQSRTQRAVQLAVAVLRGQCFYDRPEFQICVEPALLPPIPALFIPGRDVPVTELGVPTNRITDIVRGRRGIQADAALRLFRWFGTSPQFWLNLQQIYDLRIAEAEHGEEIVATIAPRDLPEIALLTGN